MRTLKVTLSYALRHTYTLTHWNMQSCTLWYNTLTYTRTYTQIYASTLSNTQTHTNYHTLIHAPTHTLTLRHTLTNTNAHTHTHTNTYRYVKHVKDIRISVFESLIRSLSHFKFEVHRKFPKTESLKDCKYAYSWFVKIGIIVLCLELFHAVLFCAVLCCTALYCAVWNLRLKNPIQFIWKDAFSEQSWNVMKLQFADLIYHNICFLHIMGFI